MPTPVFRLPTQVAFSQKWAWEYRRPNETYNDLLVPSDTDIIGAAPPLGRSVDGTARRRVQALHYAVVCLGED